MGDEKVLVEDIRQIFTHMQNKDYFLEVYQYTVIMDINIVC